MVLPGSETSSVTLVPSCEHAAESHRLGLSMINPRTSTFTAPAGAGDEVLFAGGRPNGAGAPVAAAEGRRAAARRGTDGFAIIGELSQSFTPAPMARVTIRDPSGLNDAERTDRCAP